MVELLTFKKSVREVETNWLEAVYWDYAQQFHFLGLNLRWTSKHFHIVCGELVKRGIFCNRKGQVKEYV